MASNGSWPDDRADDHGPRRDFEHFDDRLDPRDTTKSDAKQDCLGHEYVVELREIARAEIEENLRLAIRYAAVAITFLEVDDRAGRDFALRKFSAFARAAIGLRNHLHRAEDDEVAR
jgi:hypothetical protein